MSALAADFLCMRGTFGLRARLRVPVGVTALLGPSGTGKSTTLDVLAGHLRPTTGWIELGGERLFDQAAAIDQPPRRRRIGYQQQQAALFPHLSVRDNLRYGLAGRADRVAREAELPGLCERLGVTALLGRRPGTLSGGEQQRVALLRTLLPRPAALLLDEPLSAVDAAARRALLGELRTLFAALAVPVLYVSHDEAEAEALAQAVLRLRRDGDRVLLGAGGDDDEPDAATGR